MKNHLRSIALLEGISFLVLLLVAMPLKYFAGLPEAVRYTGWAHGILFVWYIVVVMLAREQYRFNFRQTMVALAGSVLPFGTFYADNKIFKHLRG
ncbi:MAG TPA: DUF3817 domain-containing protein [Flavisolibacter sp.]